MHEAINLKIFSAGYIDELLPLNHLVEIMILMGIHWQAINHVHCRYATGRSDHDVDHLYAANLYR